MVGSAIYRALIADGYENIVTRTRRQLDLCDAAAVDAFYREEQPEVVIVAAGRVGGIWANSTYPVEFLHDNLNIASNTISGAHKAGVKRLIFLGSNCIYPKDCPQPIREEHLLSGPLEPTNEAYAIAKIAGLKYCSYFRKEYGVCYHSLMPANMYGRNDNYHAQNSHVFPALLRRFHEAKQAKAKEIVIWGTGKPIREFLHADDFANCVIFMLTLDNPPDWVNVGTGQGISIRDLAYLFKDVLEFDGTITFDPSKPDGMAAKYLDTSLLKSLGWTPKIDLRSGIQDAYKHFLAESGTHTLREK